MLVVFVLIVPSPRISSVVVVSLLFVSSDFCVGVLRGRVTFFVTSSFSRCLQGCLMSVLSPFFC